MCTWAFAWPSDDLPHILPVAQCARHGPSRATATGATHQVASGDPSVSRRSCGDARVIPTQHQPSSGAKRREVGAAAERHRDAFAHLARDSPTRTDRLVRNTVVVRSNYKIMKFFFFYAERKLSCDEAVSADVRSALAAQG